MMIITDSIPVDHVYDVMPFAILDYYSEITVHLTVLACDATLND